MKNKRVRKSLFVHEVTQAQLADAIGIHEQTLSRKLRHELPLDEQKKLCEEIERLAKNEK